MTFATSFPITGESPHTLPRRWRPSWVARSVPEVVLFNRSEVSSSATPRRRSSPSVPSGLFGSGQISSSREIGSPCIPLAIAPNRTCPRRRRSAPEVSSERPVSWMVEVFLTWFWRVKVFTQSCDQPQVNDTNQSCVLAASPNVACPSPNHSRLSSLFSSFCRAIRVFLAHSSRSHGARAHAVPELKSEGTHPDPENHPPSLSQVAES